MKVNMATGIATFEMRSPSTGTANPEDIRVLYLMREGAHTVVESDPTGDPNDPEFDKLLPGFDALATKLKTEMDASEVHGYDPATVDIHLDELPLACASLSVGMLKCTFSETEGPSRDSDAEIAAIDDRVNETLNRLIAFAETRAREEPSPL